MMIDARSASGSGYVVRVRAPSLYPCMHFKEEQSSIVHLLTLSKILRTSQEIRLVVGTDIAPESAAIGRHISAALL